VCVCETIGAPSMFIVIRKAAALARMLPHFDSGMKKEKKEIIFLFSEFSHDERERARARELFGNHKTEKRAFQLSDGL
jgi:hypothetical protein